MDTRQKNIQHYLATGKSELFDPIWGSEGVIAAGREARRVLVGALLTEVKRRAAGRKPPPLPDGIDLRGFTRSKVEPMVRGLFPAREREVVLSMLERSVVFLTAETYESILEGSRWLNTTWNLANLYLGSVGAELLGEDPLRILGMSEETICYVTTEYFTAQRPFDDFIVHEAAHVFHNCKRATVGLRKMRRREWLLEIDFAKRETFAYACEAYSRIRELGRRPAVRRRLLEELVEEAMVVHRWVDEEEYRDILREAVDARNGWKRILLRCAPPKRVRSGK